jgi:hypothetical protein
MGFSIHCPSVRHLRLLAEWLSRVWWQEHQTGTARPYTELDRQSVTRSVPPDARERGAVPGGEGWSNRSTCLASFFPCCPPDNLRSFAFGRTGVLSYNAPMSEQELRRQFERIRGLPLDRVEWHEEVVDSDGVTIYHREATLLARRSSGGESFSFVVGWTDNGTQLRLRMPTDARSSETVCAPASAVASQVGLPPQQVEAIIAQSVPRVLLRL